MPERLTLISEILSLPSFNFHIWIEQRTRLLLGGWGIANAAAPRATKIHRDRRLQRRLDRRGPLEQPALMPAGRAAAERDPDQVPTRRPTKAWIPEKAGFIVDQPDARHRSTAATALLAAILEKASAATVNIAAGDAHLLCENGILKRSGGAGGKVEFPRQCAGPGAMAQNTTSGITPATICCST